MLVTSVASPCWSLIKIVLCPIQIGCHGKGIGFRTCARVQNLCISLQTTQQLWAEEYRELIKDFVTVCDTCFSTPPRPGGWSLGDPGHAQSLSSLKGTVWRWCTCTNTWVCSCVLVGAASSKETQHVWNIRWGRQALSLAQSWTPWHLQQRDKFWSGSIDNLNLPLHSAIYRQRSGFSDRLVSLSLPAREERWTMCHIVFHCTRTVVFGLCETVCCLVFIFSLCLYCSI